MAITKAMQELTEEIDDLINKNKKNKKSSNKFPLEKYIDLNRSLYEIHIEIAQIKHDVSLQEGIEWFRNNILKLTKYLIDSKNS